MQTKLTDKSVGIPVMGVPVDRGLSAPRCWSGCLTSSTSPAGSLPGWRSTVMAGRSEDSRQIHRSLTVYRQAEGRQPLQARLHDRLSRIFYSEAALVLVNVVGLAIRKHHQQPVTRVLAAKSRSRMTNRPAQPGRPVRFQPRDPLTHRLPVPFVEILEQAQVHTSGALPGEHQEIVAVAERRRPSLVPAGRFPFAPRTRPWNQPDRAGNSAHVRPGDHSRLVVLARVYPPYRSISYAG